MNKLPIGSEYTEQPGDKLISGLDTRSGGNILVYRHMDGTYSVIRDNIMRHAYGDAEMVMRALTFYMIEKV